MGQCIEGIISLAHPKASGYASIMKNSNDISALKQAIIQAAKQLYNKNLLAACDGNISYRVSDDLILITPKGRPKNTLSEDDFAIIDINNRIIMGDVLVPF